MLTCLSSSSTYPAALRQAKPPPSAVYIEGDMAVFGKASISIIGSRKMTAYAAQVVQLLVPTLVQAGLVVVSGLAFGVDSEAHTLALKHGGKGIAVLGSGITPIYPAAHTQLAQRLIDQGGAVLSEYPPGTPGYKSNFPARNRLIAALAPVLLIVEAALPSGTFSTARAALSMGREVCVVPADITRDQAQGVLTLLKEGARPITTPADILSLYQLSLPLVATTPLQPALTGSPATLYGYISRGTCSVEALCEATTWSVSTVRTVLSVLELDGYITYRQSQWQTTSLS